MPSPTLFPTIHHPKQRAFLLAYVSLGSITAAARETHCHRTSHSIWMRQPAYQAVFHAAQRQAGDLAEENAWYAAVAAKTNPCDPDIPLPLDERARRGTPAPLGDRRSATTSLPVLGELARVAGGVPDARRHGAGGGRGAVRQDARRRQRNTLHPQGSLLS